MCSAAFSILWLAPAFVSVCFRLFGIVPGTTIGGHGAHLWFTFQFALRGLSPLRSYAVLGVRGLRAKREALGPGHGSGQRASDGALTASEGGMHLGWMTGRPLITATGFPPPLLVNNFCGNISASMWHQSMWWDPSPSGFNDNPFAHTHCPFLQVPSGSAFPM